MIRPRTMILIAACVLLLAACTTVTRVEPSVAERRGAEHNQLGITAEEEGLFALAAEEFWQAYRFYAAIEHEPGAVTALINLARVERRSGRQVEALAAVEQAFARVTPRSPLHHEVAFETALVLQSLQRGGEALLQAKVGLQSAPTVARGRHRNLVARLTLESGEHHPAQGLAEEALAENRAAKNRREEANSLRLLGEIAGLNGEKGAAVAAFTQALSIDKELGLSSRIGDDLLALGDLSRSCDESDDAIDYWRRAWEVRRNSGDRDGAVIALSRVVNRLRELGRTIEANELQERSDRPFGLMPRQNTP